MSAYIDILLMLLLLLLLVMVYSESMGMQIDENGGMMSVLCRRTINAAVLALTENIWL